MMMTQPFPAHQGIPQHPGLPPGHHPMAQAQHPNMGVQAPGMVQQMHPGVSAAGPQVSQPGPMMGGMPPGATTGPGGPVANAHALQHLNPAQAHILQQQQYGMSKLPFFPVFILPLHPVFPLDPRVQKNATRPWKYIATPPPCHHARPHWPGSFEKNCSITILTILNPQIHQTIIRCYNNRWRDRDYYSNSS
jgi:hypothetical protein